MITDKLIHGRQFSSLKWKVLGLFSLVLVLLSLSLAYLVYARTTGQFDAEQAGRRQAQMRELEVVLAEGYESMIAFASFIPMLSGRMGNPELLVREHIAAALERHGALLGVEWGFEGLHYFDARHLSNPELSWPRGRTVPLQTGLLESARRDEVPLGRISCADGCVQVVALPLLEQGRTVGVLLLERSIADSLEAFHLLSGAEIALLSAAGEAASGPRHLQAWGRRVSGITHERDVLPMILTLAEKTAFAQLAAAPQRIRLGDDWYEIFRLGPDATRPDVDILVTNRVTDQVAAIHRATTDSLLLGFAGLVISELVLLMLLWGPMRRIRDVAFALPLMAEKSYARLRQELPQLSADRQPRDEIDVMISVVYSVSEQIEMLDSARSVAENALRESEQGLQLAQSMAKVASWTGQPIDGAFRVGQGADHINPVLRHVGSWDDFIALVHADDRARLRIAWRQGQAGGTMDIEFRLFIDGDETDVHAVAQFETVGPDRVLRATGMLQDVTEMRAAERVVKTHRDRLEDEVLLRTAELDAARRRAERLAQNKAAFLADMSHEMRTPLNAIIGLSQIGARTAAIPEMAATYTQILDAGEHLLRVVNDVLDLSKLEAGQLAVDMQPFDLRQTVRRCAEMLRQRIEGKALAFHMGIADDLPEMVIGDAFRVQQILLNLLSNAIKFTERGTVSLAVYREPGRCCFRVDDTGIGMSPDQMRRLFNRFQQLGRTSGQRHHGTGLGLSISHALATMMGGEIGVDSEPGVGSSFTLRIPLERARTGMPAEPAGGNRSVRRLAGVRALVADDVSINREVLQTLLELEGAAVTTVVDGAAAVTEVCNADDSYDVVLLDVTMPVMDGRQAATEIRAAGHRMPIIGVTAHVAAEEHRASLAAGMDELLIKPVMQNDLVEVIGRLLC